MWSTVLLILSFVLFVLAAFGAAVPRVNLGWLGAAALVLSMLIGSGGL